MGGVLIEVDSTVGELSERSLLLDLGGLNGVVFVSHDCGGCECRLSVMSKVECLLAIVE